MRGLAAVCPQAVRASLQSQTARALAVPEDFARQLRALLRGRAALEEELGRPSSDEELAQQLNISPKRVASLLAQGRQAAPGASLDAIFKGADRAILDRVRSPALEPAAAVSQRMRRSEVLAYLQVGVASASTHPPPAVPPRPIPPSPAPQLLPPSVTGLRSRCHTPRSPSHRSDSRRARP